MLLSVDRSWSVSDVAEQGGTHADRLLEKNTQQVLSRTHEHSTWHTQAGVTALHYAAKLGLPKCAADLLSSGAVWNSPNNDHRTPAYWGHAAHHYYIAHGIEEWGAGRKAKALDILLERNAAVVNNKDWEPDASEIAKARQRRSGAAVTSKRGARPRPPPAPPALPPATSSDAARAAALGRRLLATPPQVPPLPSTPPASGGAAGVGAGFGSAAAPVDTVVRAIPSACQHLPLVDFGVLLALL